MIRCIKIGTTTVQGTLIRELPNGMAQLQVGDMVHTGILIDQHREDLIGLKPVKGTLAVQHGGDHYSKLVVQPWEALNAWLTPDEHRGYHKGVAIGYIARERDKGGLDDLRKAVHHLQRLLEVEGESE